MFSTSRISKICMECNLVSIWQSFSFSHYFFLPFFIGLLASYSHHPTFSEYSSCPPFSGDDRPSWGFNHRIMSKRGTSRSPQRLRAWRNCRDFVRSCPLSSGDEHLVDTYLWSVFVSSWHMPVHDVLLGLCSCHSTGEIHLRVRDEDLAELVLFGTHIAEPVLLITQQLLFIKVTIL